MNIIHNTFLCHSLGGNMNIFRSRERPQSPQNRTSYMPQLLTFFILIPCMRTATFKYPSSQSDIIYQGDASPTTEGIHLTRNQAWSVGRALYAKPLRLWDSATGQVADFRTHLSFVIKAAKGRENSTGDCLAFFLAPNGSTIPPLSSGGSLGLFNESVKFNSYKNPVVAVEFDTHTNPGFDPEYREHVGLDINSIRSATTAEYALLVNNETNARISYNSSTKKLSVDVSPASAETPRVWKEVFISTVVDLKDVLPEWVSVGLTAATGDYYETHQILSWEFNSTEFPSNRTAVVEPEHGEKTDVKLVIGLVVGIISLLIVCVAIFLFMWQKKGKKKNEVCTDDEYNHSTGPIKYAYDVLVHATDGFKEDHKLGEGGFGEVYRGTLSESNMDVAVKRISQGSKQGKKEFASEVAIIGKLVHRNLVQLLGWCHEQGEFLLVYEFMPNGSLDFHLFGGRSMLTWVLRYKIANGLASALLYLHEGWNQCVVHRDIKPSNVLLDSDFNAKLGDFGLARFGDHEHGLETTIVAGTTGYIAPECFETGKYSKESDIYSFGVVALEIACGRRVILPREKENKVRLVHWVWELYVSGRLLEAADRKLSMDSDEQQMERLMVVGLWCAAHDYSTRPSIKQVVSTLNMEGPLPDLTLKMPSIRNHGSSFASSNSASGSQGYQSLTSGSTHDKTASHSFELAKKDSACASLMHSETR